MGLKNEAIKNKTIFNSLMETIKNTGNGDSVETPYYLISEFNINTNYHTEGYSLKNNTRINNEVYKLDFEKNDGTKLPVFIKYSKEIEEIVESKTVNEQFITGKWKVTKIITEKKLNEQDKVLMDIFNDAIFTFSADKKFTFFSKIKNAAIQKGLLGELNGKKWKFDSLSNCPKSILYFYFNANKHVHSLRSLWRWEISAERASFSSLYRDMISLSFLSNS